MTNLTESSVWESGVYQLEIDDPTLGGPPGFDAGAPVTGHANAQAQQLANRTTYLKNRIDVDLVSTVDPTKGSDMVGYFQPFTGFAGRSLRNKLSESISVEDFGASPSNSAAQNDAAFSAAFSYMNSVYTGLDGFLRNTPAKGSLVVPGKGIYEVSQEFTINGNYDFIMDGSVRYVGPSSSTVFTIGRVVAFDNIADNIYVLNAFTTVSGVNAFKLVNLVDCHIATKKIKGFSEALICIADARGFFGNTFNLGTFDSNIVDIHIRSENGGAPNANRFYDGFFYKLSSDPTLKHCVKISSDGGYLSMDSNLFDGCNFEEGGVNCIPILLEAGENNRFTNLRVENCNGTALAQLTRRGNIIKVRAIFNSSTEIISSGVQHTLGVEEFDLRTVFDSGTLGSGLSLKLASGRVYNSTITFRDSSNSSLFSTLSPAAVNTVDVTDSGLLFINSRNIISLKFKTNGDRRFLLKTFSPDPSKKVITSIACFDSNGTRLALTNPSIDVGTWGYDKYIKNNNNVPFGVNSNFPYSGTGSYQTPITTFQTSLPFETHPDVHYVEIFYSWANEVSDNDFTISSVKLLSEKGNAVFVDTASDRNLWKKSNGYIEGSIFRQYTYDPPSLSAGTSTTSTPSVSGASVGDVVTVGFSNDLQGLTVTAWVNTASQVTIQLRNNTASTIDLASGTMTVLVRKLLV